jgi:hypothetical protein
MADMPTKPVLALVGIGAVLLTAMALIGQQASRPAKQAQAPKVVQALPDAFDRGEAGLSAGAAAQAKNKAATSITSPRVGLSVLGRAGGARWRISPAAEPCRLVSGGRAMILLQA